MPGGLPQGLVSTKEVVSGEIESVDRVEAEDVQKLWKGTVLSSSAEENSNHVSVQSTTPRKMPWRRM